MNRGENGIGCCQSCDHPFAIHRGEHLFCYSEGCRCGGFLFDRPPAPEEPAVPSHEEFVFAPRPLRHVVIEAELFPVPRGTAQIVLFDNYAIFSFDP